MKLCALVIMALNKKSFGRKESKIRHDYRHCWMSFGKTGNAEIIISSQLAFYSKILLRMCLANFCTIKTIDCAWGHVHLLYG